MYLIQTGEEIKQNRLLNKARVAKLPNVDKCTKLANS